MLQSDFVEEFKRVENVITTNIEKPVVDRSGRVTLTTPFFDKNELINVRNLFAFQNINPQDANLLIDGITIWSADPDFSNYLPLKIDIGAKQQIEFSGHDAERSVTNYQIITNPPINLQTVANSRYETPITFKGNNIPAQPPIIYVHSSIIVNDVIYSLVYFGPPNNSRIVTYDINTNDTAILPLPLENIGALYSNEYLPIGYYLSGGGNTNIVNLSDGTTYVIPASQILNIFLEENRIYVISQELNFNLDFRVIQYRKDTSGSYFELIYSQLNISASNPLTGVLNPYTVGQFNTNEFWLFNHLANPQEIRQYKLSPNGTVSLTFKRNLNQIVGAPQAVFVGGSDLTDPSVGIFTLDGTTLNWYFYPDIVSQTNGFKLTNFNVRVEPTVINDLSAFPIILYRNQALFQQSDNKFVLANIDDGNFIAFDPLDISPNPPFSFSLLQDGVGINGEYLIKTEKTPNENGLFYNLLRSERSVNTVYQYVQSYDGRAFNYDINGQNFKFEITLPNNTPILDAQIFKFVCDVRLRYTKQKRIVNPTRAVARDQFGRFIGQGGAQRQPAPQQPDQAPQPEAKQPLPPVGKKGKKGKPKEKKFVAEDNRELTASEVLGYVDEDFELNQFLKLYIP